MPCQWFPIGSYQVTFTRTINVVNLLDFLWNYRISYLKSSSLYVSIWGHCTYWSRPNGMHRNKQVYVENWCWLRLKLVYVENWCWLRFKLAYVENWCWLRFKLVYVENWRWLRFKLFFVKISRSSVDQPRQTMSVPGSYIN